MAQPVTTSSVSERWSRLVRGIALYLFALAHMQDATPILCPVSLALVIVAFAREFTLYRRPPSIFFTVAAWTVYLPLLALIHGNFADGTATALIGRQGRLIYTLAIFVVFAHLRPTVLLEPLLLRSAMLAAATDAVLGLYSYLVATIEVNGQPFSDARFISGMLGGKGSHAQMLGTYLVLVFADWLHSTPTSPPSAASLRAQRFNKILAAPVLAAFVGSKSRLTVIALTAVWVIGAVWLGSQRPRARRMMLGGCLMLAFAAGIAHFARPAGEAEQTTRFRLAALKKAVHQIALSPILGIGMGTFEQLDVHFREIVPNLITLRTSGKFLGGWEELEPNQLYVDGGTHVHNSYVQAWLDFGLVGCIFYVVMFRELVVRIRYVLAFDWPAVGPQTVVRYVSTWEAAVATMTLVYMCVSALATAYIFIGPITPMFLAISFGRLVAATEWMRAASEKQR